MNARIPRELDRIIGKALEKDRNLRYQHAADLEADLKRLKAKRRGYYLPAKKPRADRSTRYALTAAGAIAAIAILAGWIWLHRAVPGDHHEIVLADFENSTGDRGVRQRLEHRARHRPEAIAFSADRVWQQDTGNSDS